MEKERKKISLVTYVVSLIIMMIIISVLAVMLLRNSANKESTKNTLDNENKEITENILDNENKEITENISNNAIQEEKEIKLSNKELKELTNYFNATENNGFLLSTYENVKDVNLKEVLANGAGFAKEISDEDRLIEIVGYPVTIAAMEFSTEKLNAFLEEKTGTTYDLEQLIDEGFQYKEEYDAYYYFDSGTNYTEVSCISGIKKGNHYKIKGKFYDYNTEKYDKNFTVEVDKVKNEYRFMSNTIY